MAVYAQIDDNNIVLNIIVLEPEMAATGLWGDLSKLIDLDTVEIINSVSIGFIYHSDKNGFSAPQPYPSWTFNEATLIWSPPVPYPDDGKVYVWEEALQEWKQPL